MALFSRKNITINQEEASLQFLKEFVEHIKDNKISSVVKTAFENALKDKDYELAKDLYQIIHNK